MEEQPELPRVFIAPEVIEVHLQQKLPIPEGTVKLIWVIKQLFERPPDDIQS